MECILATENNPLWGYSNLQGANFQSTVAYILITILIIISFDTWNYEPKKSIFISIEIKQMILGNVMA